MVTVKRIRFNDIERVGIKFLNGKHLIYVDENTPDEEIERIKKNLTKK